MAEPIKVVHVEDYRIIRDGIKLLLKQDPEIELVGQAADAGELFILLKTVHVDVIVLDIYLDAMRTLETADGFEICNLLRINFPDIRVMAHSVYDDADRVTRILKEGAMGFVSKKSGFQELIDGIKSVHHGEIYICSETSKRLKNLKPFLAGVENVLRNSKELFSPREREVLSLLSVGKSSREIARSLFVTERTIESHRKNMILKAEVKNTVELAVYATSMGVIKR